MFSSIHPSIHPFGKIDQRTTIVNVRYVGEMQVHVVCLEKEIGGWASVDECENKQYTYRSVCLLTCLSARPTYHPPIMSTCPALTFWSPPPPPRVLVDSELRPSEPYYRMPMRAW